MHESSRSGHRFGARIRVAASVSAGHYPHFIRRSAGERTEYNKLVIDLDDSLSDVKFTFGHFTETTLFVIGEVPLGPAQFRDELSRQTGHSDKLAVHMDQRRSGSLAAVFER